MTNNPLDAREAAVQAALKALSGYTLLGGRFGDTAARVAIPAAIDAFIKASSTEDGGEREIRERHEIVDRDQRYTDKIAHHDRATLLSTTAALRSQNAELKLELAKEREKFTMHTAHVGAWLSAAAQELGLGGTGDNLDVATVLTQIMDHVKAATAVRSRVGELEKERDKWKASAQFALCEKAEYLKQAIDLAAVNEALQSDLEQMRKERDRELSALRERCAKVLRDRAEYFEVQMRDARTGTALKAAFAHELRKQADVLCALPITPHTEEKP